MLQIPHEFILLQGASLFPKREIRNRTCFSSGKMKRPSILSIIIEEIEKEGLTLMHLRNVPTCPEILGGAALANEPDIKQIFITGFIDSETADRRLYIIRKRIENKVRRSDIAARDDFISFVVTLRRNIIYKGMLSSLLQLRNSFDLTKLFYQRTGIWCIPVSAPTPSLHGDSAQPFRLWRTTVKSIPYAVTVADGSVKASCPLRPWRHQRTASHHPAEHER